tara:strand:+ start:100 stop:495 length:396 start_codon:yes stop_codon:yes gene_type:complete
MDPQTTTALTDMLLNAPPLVAFAGYLIWQSKGQQKRLDDLTNKWMEQISTLEDKSQKREDALRIRYDEVILKIETSRDATTIKHIEVVQAMTAKVQAMTEKITSLALDFRALLGRIDLIESDVNRLKASGE